jgi:hypothetical protein
MSKNKHYPLNQLLCKHNILIFIYSISSFQHLAFSFDEMLIPPIRELQHQSTIPDGKWGWVIIVGKNEEQITCRFISPLKPGIDIQIFLLVIVLNEGCKKQFVTKSNISPRTYKP